VAEHTANEPTETPAPDSGVLHDQLLDHSYDGIQEYDNPLPGWWVWLFVLSIVFALIYPVYYHYGDGDLVADEYAADVKRFEEEQAARMAQLGELSEESLAELAANQVLMAQAAEKFVATCGACHGAQGQGVSGPNLTDDAWVHGGTLMEIHETIDQGVDGKGMPAWGQTMPPMDVRMLSAYVGTLRGTNPPNPKAPEGTPINR
jgi:cytochrome c oxidase cbb3-type subunit III